MTKQIETGAFGALANASRIPCACPGLWPTRRSGLAM